MPTLNTCQLGSFQINQQCNGFNASLEILETFLSHRKRNNLHKNRLYPLEQNFVDGGGGCTGDFEAQHISEQISIAKKLCTRGGLKYTLLLKKSAKLKKIR